MQFKGLFYMMKIVPEEDANGMSSSWETLAPVFILFDNFGTIIMTLVI